MSYPRIDQDLKSKWVEALRSGEYTQTRGAFSRWNVKDGSVFYTYCALGVLGKLTEGSALGFVYGLGQKANRIAAMNDLEGYTFSQIADWIEANVPCEVPELQIP